MKFKIAVVQMEIRQYEAEANLRKAEDYIKKAAQSGANIIVFPEDFVTGPIERRRDLADSKKEFRDHFQKLAIKNKIDIVPGSFIEKQGAFLYNVAYYITSEGEVTGEYRKINLWHPERPYIKPGKKPVVFNTKYGKIGLIICWDLIFPEIFREMLKEDVKIVICPSYWCYGDADKGQRYNKDSEVDLVNATCVTRAFENEIVMIYCNAAGKLKLGNFEDRLIGRSQITMPFKGSVKRLNHNEEEMFIQEIEPNNILKDAESVYKIRKDLKKRVL
ncbi:MAG TPA: carbon-nitrogen hydrolase family protein [Candidatus Nanoarchaeia archaeon]|nr:carbon-nitrogen hydrolase family protein [Candidatus Nanoarchaeia archaeon]